MLPPPDAPARLLLHPFPFLRDCDETAVVRPISSFCRAIPHNVSKLLLPAGAPDGMRAPILDFALERSEPSIRADNVVGHADLRWMLRASARGLIFDGLVLGPAQHAVLVEEERPGEYAVSVRVYDAGEYELELTLMWEDRSMASFPDGVDGGKAPRDLPLCRPLARELDASNSPPPYALAVAHVDLPPRPPITQPCGAYGSAAFGDGLRADEGRWLSDAHPDERAAAGGADGHRWPSCRLRWAPLRCALVPYTRATLDRCVSAGVRAAFLPDPHTRELFTAPPKTSAQVRAAGRRERAADVAPERLRDASRDRFAIDAAARALDAALASASANKTAAMTHLVFSLGSWEVELLPAERYLAAWELLLGRVWQADARHHSASDPPLARPHLVWRTTPATAYRLDRSAARHAFYSNQQMRQASARQREYARRVVQQRGPRLSVHDSFALTQPRFHDSIDSRHFLLHADLPKSALRPRTCGASIGMAASVRWSIARQFAYCPFGKNVGNSVGIADLQVMLNGLCNGVVAAGGPAPRRAGASTG